MNIAPDFLVYNASVDREEVTGRISGKPTELINQFKKISELPEEEKALVLKMITAYVRDFNTQQA